jgi:hypothetical protein
VGVGLPLKCIDKPKTLCEVGEVGVVQQVGKLGKKIARRDGSREDKTTEDEILVGLIPTSPTQD